MMRELMYRNWKIRFCDDGAVRIISNTTCETYRMFDIEHAMDFIDRCEDVQIERYKGWYITIYPTFDEIYVHRGDVWKIEPFTSLDDAFKYIDDMEG